MFPSQQNPTGDWSMNTWWCNGSTNTGLNPLEAVPRRRADCSYQLDWSGGLLTGWETLIPEVSSRHFSWDSTDTIIPTGPGATDGFYDIPTTIDSGGLIHITTPDVQTETLYDFSLSITNPIGVRMYKKQYISEPSVPLPPLFVFVP